MAAIVIVGLILYGTMVLKGEHYYLISLGVIVTGLLAAVVTFESGRPSAARLTVLSVFIVTAVLSRLLLAPFPQVKPVAAVVLLGGVVLGKESGFIIGMLSMFLSNFYFMQGSWTPFQMFAMGLIGYLAGVFFYQKNAGIATRIGIAVYGFFSVLIIYGGIVDINTVFFSTGPEPEATGVLAVYLAGLPFDLVFAGTTAVVAFLLYPPMIRLWSRLEKKYVI
ncbi:MAG: ECF transporter S component [Eubacterium sp.]|nr:ECF transporter S component [Eubacterium sp.]